MHMNEMHVLMYIITFSRRYTHCNFISFSIFFIGAAWARSLGRGLPNPMAICERATNRLLSLLQRGISLGGLISIRDLYAVPRA